MSAPRSTNDTGPVIAYHVIMTYYGFWLPNDPRGSGSRNVWADHLKPFGEATYFNSQHSRAHVPHDWQVRRLAKSALKYPIVELTGKQALSVANGFKQYLLDRLIICHACAIMPDHLHLVLK